MVAVEVVRNNWDSMYILKAEQTEFADRLDKGYEGKKKKRRQGSYASLKVGPQEKIQKSTESFTTLKKVGFL